MSGSLNKVMIIGNLGADPEIRATPGGAPGVARDRWMPRAGGGR